MFEAFVEGFGGAPLQFRVLETFLSALEAAPILPGATGDDVRSYLQEERQNWHKRVGAAWQQSEDSAAVHPQRVVFRSGHQPGNETDSSLVSPPAVGKMHCSRMVSHIKYLIKKQIQQNVKEKKITE